MTKGIRLISTLNFEFCPGEQNLFS